MSRKTFSLVPVLLSAAMLVLNFGPVHAQTPGQIPMFDQPGTGSCGSTGGNDCIDSVITQDANGNIGIGTSSPIVPLQLNKDGNYAQALFETFEGTNPGVTSYLTLLRARGTAASPAAVLSGDRLGVMEFGGYDGSGFGARANIIGAATENWSPTGRGTKLQFFTTSNGTPDPRERMVINDNGYVGIGKSPTAQLDVEGGVRAAGTVQAFNDGYVGMVGETNNPSLPGVLALSAGRQSTNLGLQVAGRFTATGTKNAVVPLQDGQHVLLTAEESTEVWFSDYGTAHLVNGRAVVQIDATYLQTVNTEKDYHVFLTARGNPEGALYIDNETPSSFEIRESTGTASIKVSYRIVAKRKDFADERLKKVDAPLAYREQDTKAGVSARPDLQATGRIAAMP